jgi:hypothetical protein
MTDSPVTRPDRRKTKRVGGPCKVKGCGLEKTEGNYGFCATVRPAPGCLSSLGLPHRKSALSGGFPWVWHSETIALAGMGPASTETPRQIPSCASSRTRSRSVTPCRWTGTRASAASTGLGCIVALHYHSSTPDTRFANIFGASVSEAAMRPNPRQAPGPGGPPLWATFGPPRSGPARGGYAPFVFSALNRFRTARLYGRAGHSAAQNGDFRPLVPPPVWFILYCCKRLPVPVLPY